MRVCERVCACDLTSSRQVVAVGSMDSITIEVLTDSTNHFLCKLVRDYADRGTQAKCDPLNLVNMNEWWRNNRHCVNWPIFRNKKMSISGL